jgi:hypothetical protein
VSDGIQVRNSLVETKVAAGSVTTIIAGYLAWAVIYYVPAVRNHLPADLQNQLPFMFAWLLATGAAYFAPHTHRPDLGPPAVADPFPPSGQDQAPPHA